MPRRGGPGPSKSLFASLPFELRQSIRSHGAVQATSVATTTTPTQGEITAAVWSSSGVATAANGAVNGGEHVELVRTQPESPPSSGSSSDSSDSSSSISSSSSSSSESEDEAEDVPESQTVVSSSNSHETSNTGSSSVVPAPTAARLQNGHTFNRDVTGDCVDATPPAGPSTSTIVKRIRTEAEWTPSTLKAFRGRAGAGGGGDSEPARKKRKGKQKAQGYAAPYASGVVNEHVGHPWDCTGLVERYESYGDVPADIKKYFGQRHLLFEEYDTLPILMDHTGWFSVTAQPIARHIAERCRCDVIVDAFCGVGGNAIEFAKTCERVIAIDNDLDRLRLARHNALQYGVADRIEFIHGSYLDFARSYASRQSSLSATNDVEDPSDGESGALSERIDVVFLSPPWGGIDYLTLSKDPIPFPPSPMSSALPEPTSTPHQPSSYPLSAIEPIPGDELFRLTAALTPNIAYYLPRNTNLNELARLARDLPVSGGVEVGEGNAATTAGGRMRDRAWVEVEEEWVGGKVKAITAYYGGLVSE